MLDGNPGTVGKVSRPYFSSSQVDLGQPSPISSLELVARQDADETSARANYQFRCSNSSDGSKYTVIASQGSVPKEPYSTFAAAVPGTDLTIRCLVAFLHSFWASDL